MSKKSRYQHSAQNLCQMFCGYQLMHDYEVLAKLERGILELDALSLDCKHNDNVIERLEMANILHEWLKRDLGDHGVSLSEINRACLVVEFQTDRQVGQRDKNVVWTNPTPHFVSCSLKCLGKVEVEQRVYEATYQDEIEWPEIYSVWRLPTS